MSYQTSGGTLSLVTTPTSTAAPYISGTNQPKYTRTENQRTNNSEQTIPFESFQIQIDGQQLSPRATREAIRAADHAAILTKFQSDAQSVSVNQFRQEAALQRRDMVEKGQHNETLRWDNCEDLEAPLTPKSRAVREHGQHVQSGYRPDEDSRDFNTPVSPRGVRVVQHTSGQGQDCKQQYGGINGATRVRSTSIGDAASNVVRSGRGVYHYVNRTDMVLSSGSENQAQSVTGATKVVASTSHTATPPASVGGGAAPWIKTIKRKESNRNVQPVDTHSRSDRYHSANLHTSEPSGSRGQVPTGEGLSPRSRAVMEHGQTVQSLVLPNQDDREYNTQVSPRGVRVVQHTTGQGKDFGAAPWLARSSNGNGSNVVRTDGGAYNYVDKKDNHMTSNNYYMELLGRGPGRAA